MLAQIETAFAQRAGSEERLRSFLADASHELRTPLTSIQGYAELLRKDALPDQEARDRALARIEQEAARMGLLVGDLAVLAREGEGPTPEATRVDLGAVVADVVADARTIDGTRTIELEVAGPVPVLGDRGRLEQLVHNLVDNALAHTPDGTPVARPGGGPLRDGGGPRRSWWCATTVPGMPPDQAERVFDRFYRASTSTRDGGSGLGLFIVATLARASAAGPPSTSDAGRGLGLHRGAPARRLPSGGSADRPATADAAGCGDRSIRTAGRGRGPMTAADHGAGPPTEVPGQPGRPIPRRSPGTAAGHR